MMPRSIRKRGGNGQRGFSLLEAMIACMLMITCSAGLLALFGFAIKMNTSQGDEVTRTTEYAQDKMEQLMALSMVNFDDVQSDVTQYPTQPSSSGATCCGLAHVANTLNTPTTGYVDYVDKDGVPSTSSANAVYVRTWQIDNDLLAPTQVKTITVLVVAKTKLLPPQTTLVSQVSRY
jgi:Tfp pilus assembly protein PilV